MLPRRRIGDVLNECHGGVSGGHLGINKALEKVRSRFYWLNSRNDVIDWCRKCDRCAAVKGPQRRNHGKMQQYNVGAPFERIAIDIAGPLPISENGNKYVLTVIDYFSKWPELYAIPNQEAVTVAEVFVKNWVCRFGVPLEIHSDQGRNFEASIFGEMCKLLGINKTRTTPLHPQSDGMVERFNRTMEQHLAKVVNERQRVWDRHISIFLLAYRTASHDTTGITPARLLFGRELKLPIDVQFRTMSSSLMTTEDYVSNLKCEMNRINQLVRNRINIATDRIKTRYDIKATSGKYQEGDLVWLYNPQRKKGKSPKLQANWEEPYTIIKKLMMSYFV